MNRINTIADILLKTLLCCLLILSCKKDGVKPVLYKGITEIGSHFIITPQDEIIFSMNSGEKYELMKYGNGKLNKLSDNKYDVFRPFMYKNKIYGICDHNGNEQYHTDNDKLNNILKHKILERIESFDNGNILFVRFKNDKRLFVIEAANDTYHEIAAIERRWHNWAADVKRNILYLSFDDRIIEFNLNTKRKKQIPCNLPGEKRNLYFSNNVLYFNNNSKRNFQAIYEIDLKDKINHAKLVHKSSYDVMMPKIKGNYLYYIENIRNEYLLKRKHVSTGSVETLTPKGVVYQYEFYKNNRIVLIYSDFNTPKSLMIYDTENRTLKNISGGSLPLKAHYIYKDKEDQKSPAYLLVPDGIKIHAIILFFHPGLHSDFSPRWDTVLMTLLENGYMIAAPNYPMSRGYGKKYHNLPYKAAVYDMTAWYKYLKAKYKDIDLFFMSASSGNLLMEDCLRMGNFQIKGVISLFGLYSREKPELNIPAFYVLGKNDPFVDYNRRTKALKRAGITVLDFADEGHWLRKKENTDRMLKNLIRFLNE